MRKQDIKLGVVYAYRESSYGSLSPVRFLAAPADGRIYGRSSVRGESDKPFFTRAREGAKPGRHTGGYPVVMIAHRDTIPESAGNTLADFESATTARAKGGRFTVVTNLVYIIGPYEQVASDEEARARADREKREAQRQAEQESRTRAIDILTALSARDIAPNRIPGYGLVDSISLSLGEAEKLIALLSEADR